MKNHIAKHSIIQESGAERPKNVYARQFHSLLLFLFLFTVAFSCATSVRNACSECNDFYKFISENWIQLDLEKKLYGFKENPEYWKDQSKKYFRKDCIVGLDNKQVVKLLGHPSKSFIFYDLEIAYYCMEEGCLKSVKSGSKELVINYDTNGMVVEAYLNPLGVDSD